MTSAIVHILEEGQTLCGFADGAAPCDWPNNHVFVGLKPPPNAFEIEEAGGTTCESCFHVLAERKD